MTITALVPSHQEEDNITTTIAALKDQTVKVDRIIVVADNCTDMTVPLSLEAGAEVFETAGNTARKAGALNQALSNLDLGEYVIICDADTLLVPEFVETALARLESDPELGAVGAVFVGSPTSLLERCQHTEWVRYGRTLSRTGRVWVLSGTGALIRTKALEDVAEARGTTLPGRHGDVYLSDALTEDFELSLALKTLGWTLASPVVCKSVTELMPTWGLLWGQRVRWYGGALETIRFYGVTRVTWRYWWQQVMLSISTFFMALYLLVMGVSIGTGQFAFTPFWTVIGLVFVTERVVSVWNGGNWRERVLALTMFPELAYAIYLQAIFVVALLKNVRGKRIAWTHATASAT